MHIRCPPFRHSRLGLSTHVSCCPHAKALRTALHARTPRQDAGRPHLAALAMGSPHPSVPSSPHGLAIFPWDVLPRPVPSVCPSVSRRSLFPPSPPVEGIHFIHGIITTPRCLSPSAARFIRSACPVIQYRSPHCTALLRAARGKRYDTTDDAGTLAQISRPGAKKNCRRLPVLAAKSWVVLSASTAR